MPRGRNKMRGILDRVLRVLSPRYSREVETIELLKREVNDGNINPEMFIALSRYGEDLAILASLLYVKSLLEQAKSSEIIKATEDMVRILGEIRERGNVDS